MKTIDELKASIPEALAAVRDPKYTPLLCARAAEIFGRLASIFELASKDCEELPDFVTFCKQQPSIASFMKQMREAGEAADAHRREALELGNEQRQNMFRTFAEVFTNMGRTFDAASRDPEALNDPIGFMRSLGGPDCGSVASSFWFSTNLLVDVVARGNG